MKKQKNIGKVYLIGAGPGDPGLITLKALECLKRSNVIVYDRLIPKEILKYCPKKALLKYAGKEKGNRFEQEDINQMLLGYALQGKIVTRLKGGDPFVFGRGNEEMDFLKSNGVACEAVPGVSSCYAVPEASCIPLTDRKLSSGFMVLTGHEDINKKDHGLYWKHAAKFPGTIVIMMGLSNLREITSTLISLGKSQKMPAAVIASGTTKKEKIATGSLSDIADKAKGFKAPAICVIGDVVNIGLRLNNSLKPLKQKKYLTTASDALNNDIARSLKGLGASVECLPLIRIAPNKDTALLDKVITQVKTFDRLVFTSRHGVYYFLKRFFELKGNVPDLSGKIACVGTGTEAEFARYSIKVAVMPRKFTTKDLALKLIENGVAEKKVALLRTKLEKDPLKNMLTNAGACITDCIVYSIEDAQDKNILAKAIARKPDGIFFLSPRSTHRFFKLIPDNIKEQVKKNNTFLSIGPVTTKALKAEGADTIKTAGIYTVEGLVKLAYSGRK